MDATDLLTYIEKHHVAAEVVSLDAHTPTVEAAAQAVGTISDRIVKTLLFLVDEEPVLVIACGLAHVDRRALASHFNVGRKRVKLADAAAVLENTGYPVGTVPPFGHKQPLRTFIDQRVLQQPEVYAGGGGIDTLVRVAPHEIVRLTHAVTMDLLGPQDDV
jgi:Cys-tRNA(Pro) deacylase